MFIPTVVCVRCGQAMKPEKNGVVAEALTGGRPYYKVRTDKHKCPSCGVEVLIPAKMAQAEHFEPNYGNLATTEVFELN